MVKLSYFMIAVAAVLVAVAGLVAIPDPLLRATLGPTMLTVILLMAGTSLLAWRERASAGPAPPAMPTHRTNEPENADVCPGIFRFVPKIFTQPSSPKRAASSLQESNRLFPFPGPPLLDAVDIPADPGRPGPDSDEQHPGITSATGTDEHAADWKFWRPAPILAKAAPVELVASDAAAPPQSDLDPLGLDLPVLILTERDAIDTNEPERATPIAQTVARPYFALEDVRPRGSAPDDTNEPKPASTLLRFSPFTLFGRKQHIQEYTNEPEPKAASKHPSEALPPFSSATGNAGAAGSGEIPVVNFAEELDDLLLDRGALQLPLRRPGGTDSDTFEFTASSANWMSSDETGLEERQQSIARAIQEDSLTPVRVPVVSLPQRRRRMVTVQLECRHAGIAMDPHRHLGTDAGELRASLDLELVAAAAGAASRPVPGTENLPVIAHVSTGSFASEEALQALSILLGRRGAAASALHIVLDRWPTDRMGTELVALLRRTRVVIGLDLNERPHLSPDALAAREVGLVCVASAELHHASLSAYDGDLIQDFRTMARRGIEVVVTGIRTERTLAEALDFPIQLGTGDLFGRIG